MACSSPPAILMDSIPLNPPVIWRAAMLWPGCEGSPG